MTQSTHVGMRLNIGLVTPGFSADESDWCIPALLNLVRRLAATHDVTVYTLRYPPAARSYTVAGARVRALGGATSGGARKFGLLWRAVGAIMTDASHKPFSLLHGLWADEPGLVAALAGRRLRLPVLVSLMGGELAHLPELDYGGQLRLTGRLLTTLSLRLATSVSAGSQQLLERAGLHVPRNRLRFLPLGVDTSTFFPPPRTSPPPPYHIVHVASLTGVKDQDTLLRAFARALTQLSPIELILNIAGDGPRQAALAARARELGIQDHVRWLGAVAHHELPLVYRHGHLFVLSSQHESQSMALLEAACCGLPAVGTAVGLLPQLLPAAQLAPTGDVHKLAQCLVYLLSDEERRRGEARRMQELVRNRYSLENCVRRLEGVYAGITNRHPGWTAPQPNRGKQAT